MSYPKPSVSLLWLLDGIATLPADEAAGLSRLARAHRSPERSRRLRSALDEEDAGHERLAGKMVGEERQGRIEPFLAEAPLPVVGNFEGVEEREAGAVRCERGVHGVRKSCGSTAALRRPSENSKLIRFSAFMATSIEITS